MTEQRLKVAHDGGAAIGVRNDVADKVRPRQMQGRLWKALSRVRKKIIPFFTQQIANLCSCVGHVAPFVCEATSYARSV
jgi:hypothetical protein